MTKAKSGRAPPSILKSLSSNSSAITPKRIVVESRGGVCTYAHVCAYWGTRVPVCTLCAEQCVLCLCILVHSPDSCSFQWILCMYMCAHQRILKACLLILVVGDFRVSNFGILVLFPHSSHHRGQITLDR